MKGDITDRKVMLAHQGDRVLVLKVGVPDRALTLVHVVDPGGHELRLVDRDTKARKPDWPVSQKLWEAIEEARENKLNCRWEVTVK